MEVRMELVVIFFFILFGLLGHKFWFTYSQVILHFLKGFWVSTEKGRDLLAMAGGYYSSNGGSISLPQYKFFEPLMIELKSYQLKFGLAQSSILKNLRPWLSKDLQFEESNRKALMNSLMQFVLVSGFTWIFYFSSLETLGDSTPTYPILILQFLGFVSFLFVYQRKKQMVFLGVEELFKRGFIFQSLKGVGLSMGEVLSKSRADQNFELKEKDLRRQGEYLIALCHKWTKEGHSIEQELNELLEELSFMREERARSFGLLIQAYRFIHLIFFFLSGYFLLVYGLIRQLALSY